MPRRRPRERTGWKSCRFEPRTMPRPRKRMLLQQKRWKSGRLRSHERRWREWRKVGRLLKKRKRRRGWRWKREMKDKSWDHTPPYIRSRRSAVHACMGAVAWHNREEDRMRLWKKLLRSREIPHISSIPPHKERLRRNRCIGAVRKQEA